MVAGGVSDVAVKVPHHTVGPKTGRWTASREPASLWGTELDGKTTIFLQFSCLSFMCKAQLFCFVAFHKSVA